MVVLTRRRRGRGAVAGVVALITACASGLSATVTPTPVRPAAAAPPAAPPRPSAEPTIAEARDALVAAVASVAPREAVVAAMDAVLRANTASYETRPFVEYALGGRWRLRATSNARNATRLEAISRERDVVVEAVHQTLDFEGAATLTNAVSWRRPSAGDRGVLEAACAVDLAASVMRVGGWTLSFGPTAHALKPAGTLAPGTDVPALVDAVARLAPFELFDPHGTTLDLAYADPELRIMGVGLGSKRGANNLHLLERTDGPWGLDAARADDDDDDDVPDS